MGHEYKYNPQQLHHYRNYSFHQRTTASTTTAATAILLPMLCRVSIKDVKLKQCKDRSDSISKEPSSPKVSCIGQIKRGNNKIFIGFPTPHDNKLISSKGVNSKPTNKLMRFFSGKNLIPSAAATAGGSENSCRELMRRNTIPSGRKSRKVESSGDDENESNSNHVGVNVSELDPPLPVVKRVAQPGGGGEVNLWNRRSGGGRGASSLKTLQIQRIHFANNNLVIPPTAV